MNVQTNPEKCICWGLSTNSVILGCLQSSANYLSYSVLIGLPAGFKLKPLDYLHKNDNTVF